MPTPFIHSVPSGSTASARR